MIGLMSGKTQMMMKSVEQNMKQLRLRLIPGLEPGYASVSRTKLRIDLL